MMEHISTIITRYLRSIGIPAVDRLATMPYQEYLQTPEWHAKRHLALKRAGYKCQKCYHQDRLEVHHLTYERRGHELPSDLMVLCRTCHEKERGVKHAVG